MQKASALVSASWLDQQIKSQAKNVRLLDGSWHPPVTKRDALEEYRQSHIPGAVFFDHIKCSAPESSLGHTLPDPDYFSEFVGKLGIDNDTHVVVYENNAHFGVYAAPRVFWMFRAYGHNNVSVLDGGLPLWIKEGHPTTDVVPEVDPRSFKPSFTPELLKSFADIEANLETEKFKVMDARPKGMFTGEVPMPQPGIGSGHIPNSINVPFTALLQEEEGISKYKSPDALKEVFAQAGLDLSKPITACCGSGVAASNLAMAAYLTGKEDVPVYDGAWEEYYLKMKDTKPENIVKGD